MHIFVRVGLPTARNKEWFHFHYPISFSFLIGRWIWWAHRSKTASWNVTDFLSSPSRRSRFGRSSCCHFQQTVRDNEVCIFKWDLLPGSADDQIRSRLFSNTKRQQGRALFQCRQIDESGVFDEPIIELLCICVYLMLQKHNGDECFNLQLKCYTSSDTTQSNRSQCTN